MDFGCYLLFSCTLSEVFLGCELHAQIDQRQSSHTYCDMSVKFVVSNERDWRLAFIPSSHLRSDENVNHTFMTSGFPKVQAGSIVTRSIFQRSPARTMLH